MDPSSGPAHHLVSVYHNIRGNDFAAQAYNMPSQFQKAPAVSERQELPKVGQTRCYWALLSASLQFAVLDPVLSHHLHEQAANILDHNLLDFVHPDERESARRDLGNVLAERTLHGSVTRVRYCRLSRVRRLLGWSDSSLPYPPSFPAEAIAVDAEYMAVYLVVNCVADGVVLCFIHAVVDIAPHADNDELHKTGWSNWCSTYGFDQEQANALYHRLCEFAMPIARDIGDPSLRVLQILRNQLDRPLVLSWPPDSTLFHEGYVMSVADSLSRLAQYVQFGYNGNTGSNNDARTSCTRRYKSVQSIKMPTVEGLKSVQVESILIPHGTIIFACHKINHVYPKAEQRCFATASHHPLERTSDIDFRGVGDGRNSMTSISHDEYAQQHYVRQWADDQSQAQDTDTWSQPRAVQSSIPSETNSYHDFNFSSDSNHCLAQRDDGCQLADRRGYILGVPRDTSTGTSSALPPSASTSDEAGGLPPAGGASTSRVIRKARVPSSSPSADTEATPGSSKERGSRQRIAVNGKGQGNPPTGILSCAHCQITHSPEWRKGPSGKKDLCNACGLRYSRSRAKQEGVISRKRKNKEKVTPPLSNRPKAIVNQYANGGVSVDDVGPSQHSARVNGSHALSDHRSQSHPDAEQRFDGLSAAFSFVETARNVQVPYFS